MSFSDTTRKSKTCQTKKSDWYQIYFAAVLEADQTRAALKMESARSAMCERLLELRRTPSPNAVELQDIDSAMTYLTMLLNFVEPEGIQCD